MSTYADIAALIEAVIPDTWKFTDYEPSYDVPDVTGVTLKMRTLSLPITAGLYDVEMILTITSGNTSREGADPQLFDDLLVFAHTLDTHPSMNSFRRSAIAQKTVGDDEERLAYDITLTANIQIEET